MPTHTTKPLKEFCKRGHPLSGDNLRVYRGFRQCKACNRLASDGRYKADELLRLEGPALGNVPEPIEPPLSTPPDPGLPLYLVDVGVRLTQRINQIMDRHTRIYGGMWAVKGKRISQAELSRRTAIPRTTLRRYLIGEWPISIPVADRLLHAMGWTLMDLLKPSEYHDLFGKDRPKKLYPEPTKTLRPQPGNPSRWGKRVAAGDAVIAESAPK